jgi:predicted nucleotidyltransferase
MAVSHPLIYANAPQIAPSQLDEIYALLIAQHGEERIRSIILRGSFARGDFTPYSDVDITCLVYEKPDPVKRFVYTQKRLISMAEKTLEKLRASLLAPEQAVFALTSLLEDRILLDKDGAFRAFQQELAHFRWEPLQIAANEYASWNLMRVAEHAQKVLSAFAKNDLLSGSSCVSILFMCLPELIGVQRGIMLESGAVYARQVQEAVGLNSAWTYHHQVLAGLEGHADAEQRALSALRLYQETAHLLMPILQPEHRTIIEQIVQVIDVFENLSL